ncbi:MAG: 1-aminocyclopropane-1-carboxylate deaminase [Phenylobacterium sp.]|jgi:1-aminocyclopropane-1-carboxylate deaminase
MTHISTKYEMSASPCCPMKLANTPVELITVNGQHFYLKRDDLLHPDFSGNKARKFYSLLQQDLTGIDKIISYGSPQANSLHSLAVLAQLRQLSLDYYVDHIAAFMQQNPAGNYRAALANGANILVAKRRVEQSPSMDDFIRQQVLPIEPRSLYIPEGGHYQAAEVGIKLLADEIIQWAQGQGIVQLKVVLPSGTGTTALFLQKHFHHMATQSETQVEVLTCACVGGDDYLRGQFSALVADTALHPRILKSAKKYHFGKLYGEFYHIWQQLKQQTRVEFELLYDPLGWLMLLDYIADGDELVRQVPVMYIHQGGLLGNETMLPRYLRKFG